MEFVRSEPGADPIVVEAHLPVSPSQVFRAWTEPERVKSWFGPTPGKLAEVAIDLRPGGRWRFTEAVDEHGAVGFEGHYLEIEHDRRLLISWSKFTERQSGHRDTTDLSRVEITLAAEREGTFLRITHSALDDTATRLGFTHLAQMIRGPRVGHELGFPSYCRSPGLVLG